ncbi:TetR/AcrR family transcriptional regulator [Williamsia sp. CHRR-6]|uniref:TetR/AcrR family transcriptional regulator n=1 Tax=Williamsia sp. CHRR-6 TaxID=2835871 RepID=UPI001BD93C8B|nr:TetR/AcrR family transcriptional regulator [Williamsia sp. CHRR-6]MBT0567544.1 TetR family transcriptional regulator [Williamsia sp. CHRR-6]
MTLDPYAARPAWRDYGRSDLPIPLAAALSAFADHGYHGTSVREIAGRAGLSVPGLYHHYPSKQSMLQGLLEMSMDDLLWRSEQSIAAAGPEPIDRLDAVVTTLLEFHMYRREQAFIGSSEIRSLDADYRPVYTAKRRRQQQMVDEIVVDGAQRGVFVTGDPYDTGRAITTMCVGVSIWYRPDGRLSPDELVDRWGRIARDTVGYVGDSTRPEITSPQIVRHRDQGDAP